MVVVGYVLLLVGTAIGLWAASALGWRRAIGLDPGPPQAARPALVFAGPYGFVRHPRALAVVLISLGAGLIGAPLPVWVCALAAVGAVAAALRRETRLASFGDAYARYRRSVPFLVPRRPSFGKGSQHA